MIDLHRISLETAREAPSGGKEPFSTSYKRCGRATVRSVRRRRITMAGKKVLIVDDAVVMRMMIKNILSKSGYDIVGEAENGIQAVEKYKALQPDIVTMDMVMPDMDGIAAVKAIVAEFPNAKIIMCTSMGQQALVVEAIQAGAKSFITKPFQPPKIVEAIEKVLA
jgi:two-component system, chemotaxis family, chemotaxis protein CheY